MGMAFSAKTDVDDYKESDNVKPYESSSEEDDDESDHP
jgi:hypothetical protein